MCKRITKNIRAQLLALGAISIAAYEVEIMVMDDEPGFEDRVDYAKTKEAAEKAASLLGWHRGYLSGCDSRVILRT